MVCLILWLQSVNPANEQSYLSVFAALRVTFVGLYLVSFYFYAAKKYGPLKTKKNVTAPTTQLTITWSKKIYGLNPMDFVTPLPSNALHCFVCFLFWLPSQLTRQPNYWHLKLICLILNWYAMFKNSFLLSRVRVLSLLFSLLNLIAAAMSSLNIHHHFFPICGCFFQVGLFFCF